MKDKTLCLRQVAMWSKIQSMHKFDSAAFDAKRVKKDLPLCSPKLVALFQKIQELDDTDRKRQGKVFKHCVYVDFKGQYAKVVASAFKAKGFKPAYGRDMRLNVQTGNNTFALLSTNPVFGKTFTVKLKKEIISIFNDRDSNLQGEKIRFMILDSGFREGIDLFDTKYCHIVEQPPTPADEKQVIGRNTRFCGQKGLKFQPGKGWPLAVYRYDVQIGDLRVHDAVAACGDPLVAVFARQLDCLIPKVAVDAPLNKAIHGSRVGSVCVQGGARSIVPRKRMSHSDLESHIKKYFSRFKWPQQKLENKCIVMGNMDSTMWSMLNLTPTQQFIQAYFQPQCIYKGILLYHSTGTGKSCTAIATATSEWETRGYTILWVTRHTLKSDIWKNMYKQVCSYSASKSTWFDTASGDSDGRIRNLMKHPMRSAPDNWLQPISFKQFSNMCKGKNDVYHKLVERHGHEDPLSKTLIIIDEAHKLYASDVGGMERPDTAAIEAAVQRSYKQSKNDSVRLLLMTATPYTDDPTKFMRLMNLVREKPVASVFADIKEDYLDDDAKFTGAGKERFMNEFAGYISYLNREFDVTTFAHPVITDIVVPASSSVVEPVVIPKKRRLKNARPLNRKDERETDISQTALLSKVCGHAG